MYVTLKHKGYRGQASYENGSFLGNIVGTKMQFSGKTLDQVKHAFETLVELCEKVKGK